MPAKSTAALQPPQVWILPPLFFYACLVVGGVLEFGFPTSLPLSGRFLHVPAGLFLVLAGGAFMMWGHNLFTSRKVQVRTDSPSHMLVAEGAYRYSRNPMYTGGVAIMAGIGVMMASLWLLGAAFMLLLYLHLHVVPREEAYLRAAFGNRYEEFCLSVRRWL
jgi:protein-S-isoprenylcysteine O-methyltransferase Ste14